MLSVKGIFQNGIAKPAQPIDGYDGQSVIITFLSDDPIASESQPAGSDWDAFDKLVNVCEVKTGISDLAHEHDHYIHNKSKKD